MHEVRDARHASARDRERLDRIGSHLGRGRHGDGPRVVDVVEERTSTPRWTAAREGREDERAGIRLEADVVHGDVERASLRRPGTRRSLATRRALAAVRERLSPIAAHGRRRHALRCFERRLVRALPRLPGDSGARMGVVVKGIGYVRVSRVGHREGDSFLSQRHNHADLRGHERDPAARDRPRDADGVARLSPRRPGLANREGAAPAAPSLQLLQHNCSRSQSTVRQVLFE